MKELSKDWLLNGWVDFEYKQYQLLAYLKNVKSLFQKNKLYPHMSDLIFHYQNLMKIKDGKDLFQDQFPKRLSSANFSQMKINYNRILKDDEVMAEISEIIDYAGPKIQETINEGKGIFDLVDEHMEISTIGITSLYTDEGYFFMQLDGEDEINIFKYKLTVFTNPEGNHRGIHSTYVGNQKKSPHESLKSLKLKVAQLDKELDNPATYLVVSRFDFPIKETLLPISQRKLVKYIYNEAA